MKRKIMSVTILHGLNMLVRFSLVFLILVMLSKKAFPIYKYPGKMNLDYKGYEIYTLLTDSGFTIQQAKILTSQAAHETGNFTSAIFLNNNNLFGMKLPNSRQTTAIGQKDGFAYFENLEDSINDLIIYLKSQSIVKFSTVDNYVNQIKERNYFVEDLEQYKKSVKQFYNQYFG